MLDCFELEQLKRLNTTDNIDGNAVGTSDGRHLTPASNMLPLPKCVGMTLIRCYIEYVGKLP